MKKNDATLLIGTLAVVMTSAAPIQAGQSTEATAPAAETSVLEEVIVTARKRAESIIDVPVSITAVTAQDIDRAGITSVRDLNNVAPGLTFQSQMGNGPGGRMQGTLIFRGMYSSQGLARDQSGSVFVDGMYISGGVQTVNTADVERIEILRGPQNAYFGRSTFGGAINFVTRDPSQDFGGTAEASVGEYGSYGAKLSLEGAMIDDVLTARLGLVRDVHGAQFTATDGGEIGDTSTDSATLTLVATPADNFKLRFRAHVQKDDDGPMTNSFIRGTQYGSTCAGQTFRGANKAGESVTFSLGRPYFCSSTPIPDRSSLPGNFISSNTSLYPAVLARIGKPNLLADIILNNSINNQLIARAPRLDHFGMARDSERFTLQGEYTFANAITVAVNAGYEKNYAIALYDTDRSDLENSFAILPNLNSSRSVEVRVQSGQEQKFRWLAGYNLNKIEVESVQAGYQLASAFGAPAPTAGFVTSLTSDRSEVPAFFAAAEYDVLSNLTVGAEVRRQVDKSSVLNNNLTRSDFEFKDVVPRYFVRYSPMEDFNVYVTYGKGVMPGGLNGQFASATPAQQQQVCSQFPDLCTTLAPLPKVTNREIGIKQRALDGRLQYSLSFYDMKWSKINTSVSALVSTTPFVIGVVAPNDATLKGVELESRFLVTSAWSVDFALNYQKNEYDYYYNATFPTLTSNVVYFSGNELPRQPKTTALLSSTYSGKLANAWNWFVRGDISYTGKMWDSEANIVQLDSYMKTNARVGFSKDQTEIELYVKNLFDDDSWTYLSRTTSISEPGALLLVPYNGALTTVQGLNLTPSDKREFGLSVRYRF